LLLDEKMTSAFAVLRDQVGPAVPEAGLARKAVFDGVAFGAVLREATMQSASQEAARQLLHDMRQLLDVLVLPGPVKSIVMEEIDRASHDTGVQQRRRRQRALLATENPHGPSALDLADSFDILEQALA